MAVAYDASTASNSGATNVASHSFSHSVTAGTNNWLLVCVAVRQGTAPTGTTVTYNGVSMTRLTEGSDGDGVVYVAMFALSNPSTGSNTVAITLGSSETGRIVGVAYSGTGGHQTTASLTSGLQTAFSAAGNPSTSGTGTLTVTSNANALVVDCLSKRTSTNTPAVGSGQSHATGSVTTNASAAGNVHGYASDNPGAASVNMSYTWTAGTAQQFGYIAVSVEPPDSGAGIRMSHARNRLVLTL